MGSKLISYIVYLISVAILISCGNNAHYTGRASLRVSVELTPGVEAYQRVLLRGSCFPNGASITLTSPTMIPSSMDAQCLNGRYEASRTVQFNGVDPNPEVQAVIKRGEGQSKALAKTLITSWKNAFWGPGVSEYFEDGRFGFCARNHLSEVYCWAEAELDGTSSYAKTQITGLPLQKRMIALYSIENASFAYYEDGELWSWGGHNTFGRGRSLGHPAPTVGYNTPQKINTWDPSKKLLFLSGEQDTVCVSFSDQDFWCWGNNSLGLIGDGSNTTRMTPVGPIKTDVIRHIAGGEQTCYVSSAKEVFCTGRNPDGQLGNGTQVNSNTYQQALNITTAKDIRGSGAWCSLLDSGDVYCWGTNAFGNTGLGQGITGTEGSTLVPTQVAISNVVSIEAMGRNICALKADGTVWCWGIHHGGQLGNGAPKGTGNSSDIPVQVLGLTDVIKIDSGSNHTCALKKDKTVWCWGADGFGFNQPNAVNSTSPILLSQTLKVDDITVFSDDTCLMVGPNLHCVGKFSGTDITTPILSY